MRCKGSDKSDREHLPRKSKLVNHKREFVFRRRKGRGEAIGRASSTRQLWPEDCSHENKREQACIMERINGPDTYVRILHITRATPIDKRYNSV